MLPDKEKAGTRNTSAGLEYSAQDLYTDALASATAMIAHRYGLSLPVARVVCELAQLGGRLA